jgi:hypothetical protein
MRSGGLSPAIYRWVNVTQIPKAPQGRKIVIKERTASFVPDGTCAGEDRVNVGESPTCRIKLFTAENGDRAEDREVRA